MCQIREFGRNGHGPAKEVVRRSSDLLTRARALGRGLTHARCGMADMQVDEGTHDDTPMLPAISPSTSSAATLAFGSTPIASAPAPALTPSLTPAASAAKRPRLEGGIRDFFQPR